MKLSMIWNNILHAAIWTDDRDSNSFDNRCWHTYLIRYSEHITIRVFVSNITLAVNVQFIRNIATVRTTGALSWPM